MSQAAYTSYQHLICQLDPSVNPAAVEGSMRMEYHTLDHLSRDTFRQEINLAREMTEPEQRKMADSFGMAPQYEWWEGRKQADDTYLGDTEALPVSEREQVPDTEAPATGAFAVGVKVGRRVGRAEQQQQAAPGRPEQGGNRGHRHAPVRELRMTHPL